MSLIGDEDIPKRLTTLNKWDRSGNAIVKTMKFKNFQEAMAFIVRVGFLAEAANHHPDMEINYSRVTLKLTTHSAGGLTEKDFTLARQLDQLERERVI